jgi:ABC-type branched-subunit amino acid transport system ATPase component/predicted MFS family arabinose efflux permease
MKNLLNRLAVYLHGEPLFPIIVLFFLNAVDQFDSRTFDLLGPEIADSFHIKVGKFGVITLLVIVITPFIALPISYLSDRWKRMPLAIAGAVAWGAFSLATPLAPTVALLFVVRVGSSFGETVNGPVHGALIADFYSQKARLKAFGVHYLATPGGAAIATVLAGFIADALGWHAAFYILTIPTVFAILLALRLPEPERGRFEVLEQPVAPPFMATAQKLWAVRSLRYQWIGLAFTNGSILATGILVPFFLRHNFHMRPGPRGVLIGIGTALSAVGVLVGTNIAQRYLDTKPSDALRMICWVGIVAAVALSILGVAPTLWVAAICIWTAMIVFAFVTPGLRAITAAVSPPEMRSTAFALAGLIALAGTGFSLIGVIVGNSSYRWAIVVMAPIFFRGVLYFFQATKYLDDDVERLDPTHVQKATRGGGLLLETKGLTVSYDGVRVLFGVDLEVKRGEMVALLGTNGAGKSTTLNAISGIVEPDGGNVWFEGEPVTGFAPEATAARGVIQVPGGRGVFPGLSVAENLRMGCFLIRRDAALVDARMKEVTELFPRLAERMGQNAGSLSGGERQMLTLAQSFVLQPKLLLIDELSLGLAPALVQELLVAVRKMNDEGITIVLVEQSVNIALTLADRAYFMEKGEVRFEGPTSQLLKRRDLLRSVFLEGARTKR